MFNRLLEQETITYERCVRTPSRQVWKPLPTSSPTHLRLNSMPLFPLDNLGFSGVQIVVVAVAANSRCVLHSSHSPFSHSSPQNYPLWTRQSPLRHTSPARHPSLKQLVRPSVLLTLLFPQTAQSHSVVTTYTETVHRTTKRRRTWGTRNGQRQVLSPAVAAMQSRWPLLVTSDIAQRLPVADEKEEERGRQFHRQVERPGERGQQHPMFSPPLPSHPG